MAHYTPNCGISEIGCALETAAYGLFEQNKDPVKVGKCANLLLVLSDYLRWLEYCQEDE